jgi:hypothetical protein
LQRKAEAVVIAPTQPDELVVSIIEMKVTGQLIGGEFADVAAIAPLLVVG